MIAETVDEPRARSPVKDGGKFETIPINVLSPSPFNTRPPEDPELRELAENIKSVGVLEPMVVRQKPDELYEIICGMRRWKAAKMAGLAEVPCMIRGLSDEEVLLAQISENMARKDVPDIARAHQLKLLTNAGYTQTQIAEKLGKDKAWVSHHLKMLELEKLTRVNFLRKMTEGQARVILSALDDVRKKVVEWVEQELEKNEKVPSMREIQEKIDSLVVERGPVRPKAVAPPPKPGEVGAPVKCSICGTPTYSPRFLKDGRIICESCFENLSKEGLITKEDVAGSFKAETKPRRPEEAKTRCPICGHVIGARLAEVVDRLKERFPKFFEGLEEALEE